MAGDIVRSSKMPKFKVILFASTAPRDIIRLASKISKEVPEVCLSGILLNPQAGESVTGWRSVHRFSQYMRDLGSVLLRFMHACPANPNGGGGSSLEDLTQFCRMTKCLLFITDKTGSEEATEFVRQLRPDLGIIQGSSSLDPGVLQIPRLGSIQMRFGQAFTQDRDTVGYKASPLGKRELEISVHHLDGVVTTERSIGKVALPIEPFDTPESFGLKVKVLGNDLVVRALAKFAADGVPDMHFETPGQCGASGPPEIAFPENQAPSERRGFQPQRGRPEWKLGLRTLLLVPLTFRNWVRRWRGSFPVVILFHHLVSDRPHRMGISTSLFVRHIRFLNRHYKIATLDEAIAMLRAKKVNAPTVVLTFDDGYKDNFLNMRAASEELSIPITLFVCTERITAQGEFAHDQELGIRGFPALSWEQVHYMSQNGYTIGSHTCTHFDCGSTDAARLESEIKESKTELERRLNREVSYFAFPFGKPKNMSAVAASIAKNTYSYFFSADGGVNFPSSSGPNQHLLRCYHPNDIWELELALQSLLEFS